MRPTRLAAAFVLAVSVAWLALASHRDVHANNPAQEFYFHHDHVIGTSLDVWLTARDETAAAEAEDAILGEIERLRRIFSTYDADSELSQLNRTRQPMIVTREMMDVLRLYEIWQERSGGAFSGQLGGLVRLWKDAEKTQREPDDGALNRIVQSLRLPGWRSDEATGTVARLTDQPLDLNSIAKGYIIQKAAAAALAKVASVEGLLLNLGGDMFVWGKDDTDRAGWTIGVQDPHQPYDNATPIARLRPGNAAVATSGGYERYYKINGQRHAHLFDPRTGHSANGPASATVVARDNVTANALATTLCVLSPDDGLRLIAATPGTECLLVARDGTPRRSAGFAALETPIARVAEQGKAPAWPEGFQVTLALTLPSIQAKRYRRPYVAVWVENPDAKPVRTITVWGNNPRYFKDLPQWWKFARADNTLVRAVTRATRAPGKYSLAWDGKDDKGNYLPRGTYTVHVEVHREHGKLVRQSGKIACEARPAKIALAKNLETGETLIEYAKKKTP